MNRSVVLFLLSTILALIAIVVAIAFFRENGELSLRRDVGASGQIETATPRRTPLLAPQLEPRVGIVTETSLSAPKAIFEVFDANTKLALREARILVLNTATSAVLRECQANDRGRVEVQLLDGELFAGCDGYVTKQILSPPSEDATVTVIYLDKGFTVSGQVTVDEGLPGPAGMTIIAWPSRMLPHLGPFQLGGLGVGGVVTATTTAGGYFDICGLPAGHELMISATGAGYVARSRVLFRPAVDDGLKIAVLPSYVLAFVLRSFDGEALPVSPYLYSSLGSSMTYPADAKPSPYGPSSPEFLCLGLYAISETGCRQEIYDRAFTAKVLVDAEGEGSEASSISLYGRLFTSTIESPSIGPVRVTLNFPGCRTVEREIYAQRARSPVHPIEILLESSFEDTFALLVKFLNVPLGSDQFRTIGSNRNARLVFSSQEQGPSFFIDVDINQEGKILVENFPKGTYQARLEVDGTESSSTVDVLWTGEVVVLDDTELSVMVPKSLFTLDVILPNHESHAWISVAPINRGFQDAVTYHFSGDRIGFPWVPAGDYAVAVQTRSKNGSRVYSSQIHLAGESAVVPVRLNADEREGK